MTEQSSFPAPQSSPGCIALDKVLCDLKSRDSPQQVRMLLVDVRRDDHRGGTIKGSLNLPAQTLPYSLEMLYGLAVRAGLDAVVFYCGSCGGRGPRCAGWFADTIKLHADDQPRVKSLFLEGGIKGWVRCGGEYIEAMEGYEAAVWES